MAAELTLVSCTHLHDLVYSGDPQQFESPVGYITSLECPLPVEFELWSLDENRKVLLGTSVGGILNCLQGSPHLTVAGDAFCSAFPDTNYNKKLRELGVEKFPMRVPPNCTIQLLDKSGRKLCCDNVQFSLVVRSWNIWKSLYQPPFGLMAVWHFSNL